MCLIPCCKAISINTCPLGLWPYSGFKPKSHHYIDPRWVSLFQYDWKMVKVMLNPQNNPTQLFTLLKDKLSEDHKSQNLLVKPLGFHIVWLPELNSKDLWEQMVFFLNASFLCFKQPIIQSCSLPNRRSFQICHLLSLERERWSSE